MRIATILILVTLLTSCDKEEVYKSPCTGECSIEWQLEGTWHWVHTWGWHSAQASEVDYTQRIIIDGDIWREYYNDSLTYEAKFEFASNVDTMSRGDIRFDDGSWDYISLYKCSMSLGGLFEDSPEHFYCKE